MIAKIHKKIKSNLRIYKEDIKVKGIYYSIVHRLYKIPSVKTLLTPIVNFLKPDFITIDGLKLYIDKFDTTVSEKLVETKIWEPYETKLFKQNLRIGNTVLDIGAHIGYYTLLASKKVGKEGKVYAFEPDPKNFQILKKNIVANDCQNVILVNKAVTKSSATVRLYINEQNTGDHRIYDSKDGRLYISVDSISLDEFFKNIKTKVNLIKMDIQGAEFGVIAGGLKLLKENPNIKIFSEFWPNGLKLNKTSPEKFLKIFSDFGFKIYQIDEKRKKLILTTPTNLINLDSSSQDYTNLYCNRNKLKNL